MICLCFFNSLFFKVLKLHVCIFIFISLSKWKMQYCKAYTELRPNHRNVIEGYSYGKDVPFCSPTGSGKSLTFEIAPYVMSFMRDKIALPSACCIVFPPLMRPVKSQIRLCIPFSWLIQDKQTDGESYTFIAISVHRKMKEKNLWRFKHILLVIKIIDLFSKY